MKFADFFILVYGLCLPTYLQIQHPWIASPTWAVWRTYMTIAVLSLQAKDLIKMDQNSMLKIYANLTDSFPKPQVELFLK